jgi:two-component system NtrC family sensor kinase
MKHAHRDAPDKEVRKAMSQKQSVTVDPGKGQLNTEEPYPGSGADQGIARMAGRKLSNLLECLGEGASLIGQDFVVAAQSRFLAERFGELEGSKCYEGYLNLAQPCEGCPLKEDTGADHPRCIEVKAKDGRHYQLAFMFLDKPDGEREVLEIWRDITERKKIQEKISFLSGIMSNASESIIATDREGKILYANLATVGMFGYGPEELIGMELETLATSLYKERIKQEIVKSGASGRLWEGELLNRRKDGKLFYVSASVSKMVDMDGRFIALVWFQRDITQTKRYQEEMIKIEKEKTETLRILHENETAINRSLNRAKRELQEKNVELEKRTFELEAEKKRLKEAYEKLNQMQAQLLQSEKMASLGQLSAGVAHELNNPISFVHSNLGTLGEYVGDIQKLLEEYLIMEDSVRAGKPGAEFVKKIEKLKEQMDLGSILKDFDKIISQSKEGTQRVKDIVQNLKDFSHADKGELEMADVNQGMESTLNIVWNELKYKASVVKKYGLIPHIECYPQQLNQVFMNLLVNAAQAIEDKGEIRIRTYQQGDNVLVEVTDNGTGIPEESLKHIFEPFFTTKKVGKGTGLGLSVVYGIIQKHRGEIEVESVTGKGSTFRVILPIRQSAEREEHG